VNTAEFGILAATVAALVGALAGVVLPVGPRRVAVGWLTSIAGAMSIVAGASVLVGGDGFTHHYPDLLPLAGVSISLDALGAVFLVIIGLVAVPAGVFSTEYADGALERPMVAVSLPLFVWGMVLVPIAASTTTFLVAWELMALTSLTLVLAEHHHDPEVRKAGVWYGAMTHLGLVAILIGFSILGFHGGDEFAAIRAVGPGLSAHTRMLVMALFLIGFGSKAGAVPLHVWLPRAHPAAPSHASALMSGAMVKLGIYGIIRVLFDLLGGPGQRWATVVLVIGIVSALFGILHALIEDDFKRLLAYSTTENVGLIMIGVGASGLLAATGHADLAAVTMAAALLHSVNHAAFKGLLFLGAGSVLRSTGTRMLDNLGGLVHRMPRTTVMVLIGALSIAGLPPFNGFFSEWILLQGLIHSFPAESTLVIVAIPLAVAAVALTGGLAAATFVKALGTGFLARPRTQQAADATETGPAMWGSLGLLAAACIALGTLPTLLIDPISRAVTAIGPDASPLATNDLQLGLRGLTGTVAPLIIAASLMAVAVAVISVLRAIGARREARLAEPWACGRTVQTARMEYTATSFADPLQHVFGQILRPDQELDMEHADEAKLHVEAVRYQRGGRDSIERHLYDPILALAGYWGRVGRRIHNGSLHLYLVYASLGVLAILVVAR